MPDYRWLRLFGVWFLYGSFGLVVTSFAPVVSMVISDLSMSHTEMGLIMGTWQLIYIGAAIPAGMLLDKIGTRPALVIGGLLIAASALARSLAVDTATMMMAVALFGFGGPIISAGAPKVVVALFEGSSRGFAMGLYMTGPAIGGIVSLTATNAFLLPMLDGSWRSVMLLWSGIAAVAAISWFFIAGLGAKTVTEDAAATGPSQLSVIGSLLTKPTVLVVLAMSISVFLFNHGLNNWLPELLQSHSMTAVQAGYWAAIPTVMGLIGSLTIPRLATPERRFYILIALSVAACLSSFLLRFDQEPVLLSGLILQGLARASLMTVLILTLVELPEIGEKYAGVASGIFFSAAEVGGMLGPLLLGLLYSEAAGFSHGLSLLTLVTFTMITGAAWLQRRSQREAAAVG